MIFERNVLIHDGRQALATGTPSVYFRWYYRYYYCNRHLKFTQMFGRILSIDEAAPAPRTSKKKSPITRISR